MKNVKLFIGILCGYSGIFLFVDSHPVVMASPSSAQNQSTKALTEGDAALVPKFEWDPQWPKPLPNNWKLGPTIGVAVDAKDHIWVVHRPRAIGKPADTNFGVPAPPVIEFDQAGNVVQAWGGPGEGYEWPDSEHGIIVDYKDNVWIGGNGAKDSQVVKFTRDGRFLLQIGHSGKGKGSNDIENLGEPAAINVYQKTNEVWVGDGYKNHRVIIFDADTGAYKKHFTAYGNKPDDSFKFPSALDPSRPTLPQFDNPTHCIRFSNDGFVWVCDRMNSRVQLFTPDGKYVKEYSIFPRVTSDLAFSPDAAQRFAFIADFRHEKIWILRRSDMTILDSFGHPGHAGGGFTIAHTMSVDHEGNLYVSESLSGARVQRFLYKGMGKPTPGGTIPPPLLPRN